ncbi:MAG: hypothetical protein GXP38_10190 [Chloroflexi bacterium]|nr:hypothetical protein [Chloroflexota bacterium]
MMSPTPPSGRSDSDKNLAYAVLVLERQLEAYQRLHEEDIASLHAALQEIKACLIDQVQTAPIGSQSTESGDQTQFRSS